MIWSVENGYHPTQRHIPKLYFNTCRPHPLHHSTWIPVFSIPTQNKNPGVLLVVGSGHSSSRDPNPDAELLPIHNPKRNSFILFCRFFQLSRVRSFRSYQHLLMNLLVSNQKKSKITRHFASLSLSPKLLFRGIQFPGKDEAAAEEEGTGQRTPNPWFLDRNLRFHLSRVSLRRPRPSLRNFISLSLVVFGI